MLAHMRAGSIADVLGALNAGGVRYLVVGGLAVVAHGYVRATKDVDLVVQLEPENTLRAARALGELGYRPVVPVALEEFADAAKRREWIEQKHAVVLQLYGARDPLARVDLFLAEPFDFDQAYAEAEPIEVAPAVVASFVGLERLLSMKRAAGRPQDLTDIAELEALRRYRDCGNSSPTSGS